MAGALGPSLGPVRSPLLGVIPLLHAKLQHGSVLSLLCSWYSPGKNTGVGCHFLLQGIFLAQGLNLHLLPWQAGSLPLSHLGSHNIK